MDHSRTSVRRISLHYNEMARRTGRFPQLAHHGGGLKAAVLQSKAARGSPYAKARALAADECQQHEHHAASDQAGVDVDEKPFRIEAPVDRATQDDRQQRSRQR